MLNFRRYGGLLLGAVVLLGLLLTAAALRGSRPQRGGVQVAQFGLGGGAAGVKALSGPLLVAGDEQYLWVAQPQEIDEKTGGGGSEKRRAFELLVHPTNAKKNQRDLWELASFDGQRLIEGTPEVMGVVTASGSGGGGGGSTAPPPPTTAYVMMDDGVLHGYGLKAGENFPRLTGKKRPVAMVGGLDGVWVLSHGALVEEGHGPATAATATATARLAETQPVTQAATQGAATTATAAGAVDDIWYIDRFADRRWRQSVVVGKVGAKGLPSAGARVAIAYVAKGAGGRGGSGKGVGGGGRFSVIWFEPGAPRKLHVRALDLADTGGTWRETVESDVGEDMHLRLSAVTIEPQVFVVWPQVKPAGAAGGIELHGGFLGDNGTLGGAGGGMLPAMDLAGDGQLAEENVAVSRTGNSLAVVGGLKDKEGELRMWVFDTTGKKIGGPDKVEAATGWAGESVVMQNLVMIVLAGLLGVSLWHWRRKPMPMAMPKEAVLATMGRRMYAGLIDIAIPLVVVFVVTGAYRDGQWWALGKKWLEVWRSPEAWGGAPELMWVLGGYLGHVMLGEILTGRSIGKALLGIRVVSVDGTPAGVIAIIVRNLVKIPELVTGILLLYVLLNDRRQRLGDLLGRTIVVRTPTKAKVP